MVKAFQAGACRSRMADGCPPRGQDPAARVHAGGPPQGLLVSGVLRRRGATLPVQGRGRAVAVVGGDKEEILKVLQNIRAMRAAVEGTLTSP